MAPEAPGLEDYLRRPAWHQRAACRGLGVAGFVGLRREERYRRELCAGCEVRQECLDTALADPELTGLWGGTS